MSDDRAALLAFQPDSSPFLQICHNIITEMAADRHDIGRAGA
jgi:hypothetical protein